MEQAGLLQNYPNPFTDVTRIPISIDEASEVGLTVYNVLGQEVGRVEPEFRQAGESEIEFDGRDLPAGTYLYVVRIGDRDRKGVLQVTR